VEVTCGIAGKYNALQTSSQSLGTLYLNSFIFIRFVMSGSKLPIAVAIIVILAIVGILVFTGSSSRPAPTTVQSQVQGNSTVAIRLTDPPTVPSGTTALVINYSSLGVQVSNVQNSGWIYSNDSGSINLLSLLNLSQTIGTVSIPANASIENVRFNVTAATITVNGTIYNVTIPSGRVTAHVEGGHGINGTSSILLSLSPTVAAILTANTTVFVLVPSLRAIVVGASTAELNVGNRSHLNATETEDLSSAAPNLTVSALSLSVSNSLTRFSVTVKNNGNQTATIRHIVFFGNVSTELNLTSISERSSELVRLLNLSVKNSTVCANLSNSLHDNANRPDSFAEVNVSVNSSIYINSSTHGGEHNGASNFSVHGNESSRTNESRQNYTQPSEYNAHGNSSVNFGVAADNISEDFHLHFNSSVCTGSGLQEAEAEIAKSMSNTSSEFGMHQVHFKMVLFSVFQNGTIAVPSSVEDLNGSGYSIGAGQNATFNFTGQITQGDRNLVVNLEGNSTYRVVVSGEEGVQASSNVTAI
jgi:hypothetical protein